MHPILRGKLGAKSGAARTIVEIVQSQKLANVVYRIRGPVRDGGDEVLIPAPDYPVQRA